MIDFFGFNPDDYIFGIGLSEECLRWIGEHIIKNNVENVLEFGSGHSTQFMIDICEKYNLDIKIDTVDYTKNYLNINTYNNKKYNVMVRNLIETTDENKEIMFKDKLFIRSLFSMADRWRKSNIFYDIDIKKDLKPNYDLFIIDGPNGNGRAFSYLVVKEIMSSNSYAVIDDILHHDFIERLNQIFEYETILRVDDRGKNYMIVKLK